MRVIMSAVLLFFSLSAGAGAPRCEDIFLVPTRTLRTGKWSQPQLIEILQGLAALGIAICLILNRETLRQRIATPILNWSLDHEGLFQVGIFVLGFELASQFDEIRTLSEPFLKHF